MALEHTQGANAGTHLPARGSQLQHLLLVVPRYCALALPRSRGRTGRITSLDSVIGIRSLDCTWCGAPRWTAQREQWLLASHTSHELAGWLRAPVASWQSQPSAYLFTHTATTSNTRGSHETKPLAIANGHCHYRPSTSEHSCGHIHLRLLKRPSHVPQRAACFSTAHDMPQLPHSKCYQHYSPVVVSCLCVAMWYGMCRVWERSLPLVGL